MKDLDQKHTAERLAAVIIAFFILAALSVLVVYLVDPSVFSLVLKLEPATTDRFPLESTLIIVALLIFIAILIYGITKRWRWLFWLLLIANSFSILEVPATILQLTGVIPQVFPTWYSLYRMSFAVIQVGIAIWMIRIYYRYGVWGMCKKQKEISARAD